MRKLVCLSDGESERAIPLTVAKFSLVWILTCVPQRNSQEHSFFTLLFLVVDALQVFSNDGLFKLRFGVRGRSPGQLQRPTGVTVDMSGDIIVADYDNRWITIFSSDGKFKVSDGKFVNLSVPFPNVLSIVISLGFFFGFVLE